jgi:UDP-N-acetylglucosamine acyltransferase
MISQGHDSVAGVNLIGMRRAGMVAQEINAVRQAFRILYRDGLPLGAAIARLETELGAVAAVQEIIQFLRGCTNGINPLRDRFRDNAEAA